MQVTQHLPLRGVPTHELISAADQVVYFREDADAPLCPPPCECADCQNQVYTANEHNMDRLCYTRQISDAEARTILRTYTTRIRNDREFLQKQCQINGDRISTRWKKKSRDMRQKWLLQAEPDLYPHRWFIPRYTNTDPHWRDARKHRKSFLLPYLNAQALKTNPAIFFGLLHNRTHHAPEDWAPFDNRELTISWASGFYDLEYCGSCVVMHGSRYGDLVPWERKAAHRSDIVGFPRARLILEAQAYLLRFLHKLVDQILEGIDPDTPASSAKWVEMTRIGFRKSGDVASWSQYTYHLSQHLLFSILMLCWHKQRPGWMEQGTIFGSSRRILHICGPRCD